MPNTKRHQHQNHGEINNPHCLILDNAHQYITRCLHSISKIHQPIQKLIDAYISSYFVDFAYFI